MWASKQLRQQRGGPISKGLEASRLHIRPAHGAGAVSLAPLVYALLTEDVVAGQLDPRLHVVLHAPHTGQAVAAAVAGSGQGRWAGISSVGGVSVLVQRPWPTGPQLSAQGRQQQYKGENPRPSRPSQARQGGAAPAPAYTNNINKRTLILKSYNLQPTTETKPPTQTLPLLLI